MDFMNLNQAAHGDREFGYIQTRLGVARKTVVGHASNPAVTATDRHLVARGRRLGGDRTTLKLARFGDNMRFVAVTEGDKTEAELRFGVQVNTWGVNDLADAVDAAERRSEVDALVAEYEQSYDVAPELRRGGERHESLRYGARIELGLRSFLEAGGFGAFTTSFEDLGALRQLPGLAVQRLMADGYGFGAEGDWKTAVLVRAAKVMGAGLPGGASLMEDYTYHLVPGEERHPRRPHARGLPDLDRPRARAWRSIRWASAAGRTRCAWSSPRMPGPASSSPSPTCATGSAWSPTWWTSCRCRDPLPKLPVARAVWKPEPDLATSAAAWLTAGAAHHTVHEHAGRPRGVRGLRRDREERTRRDRRRTRRCASSPANCAGTRPTTGSPAACSAMATITDVAKLAGVSHQTVSRVLNEEGTVRASTQARVEDAIRQLGYRPSAAARALATRKTGTIGLISTGSALYGPSSIMLAFNEAARQAGYQVSIASMAVAERSAMLAAVDRLLRQDVEALVLIAADRSSLEAIQGVELGVPLITAESSGHTGLHSVSIDQFAGARMATAHLADLGHRRILHLAGPAGSLDAAERERGWRAELHERGLHASRSAGRRLAGRQRLPMRPAGSPPPAVSRPSSPRMTKWRSDCFTRSPRRGFPSRRMSASSASMIFQNRNISPRRSPPCDRTSAS